MIEYNLTMSNLSNMHNYDASASECVAAFPSICSSRRHRKPRPRNSPYYKRLLASHNRRRQKQKIARNQPDFSSSDECEPPSPFTPSGVPNPLFLRYMPRPSEIVPAIDDGSASDAGFDENERRIHKRRVEATRILLTSIGPKGVIRPVERWKRNRHGLDKYTPFMIPPKEDANLPDLRVPLALLSRFYRGTFLTVHRPGIERTARLKQVNAEHISPEASANECENLVSSSGSDLETTQPQAYVKSEPIEEGEIVDLPATSEESEGETAPDPTGFSKEAFLKELDIIAQGSGDDISDEELKRLGSGSANKKDTSSESEGEGKAAAPAKSKGRADDKNASDNEVREIPKPEKKSEFDLFRELLSENPSVLLEEQMPPDDEAPVVKQLATDTAADELEDCTALTDFQRDKRVAMTFCNNDSAKRPRSVAQNISAKYFHPSKRRRLGERLESISQVAKSRPQDSGFNANYAMKVMNKMGFKGRLGRQEDGRKDPVLPTRHKFRSGIGSRPAQLNNRSRHGSLLPTKFKGKSVQSGAAVGDNEPSRPAQIDGAPENPLVTVNSTHRESEGADLYTRRRKYNGSHPEVPKRENSATSGLRKRASLPDKQKPRHLEDDDMYETEDEDDGVDNGRRAILIDIDVLIKGSAQRRYDAIEKVLKDACLVPNLRKVFANEARDLCEAELLRLILGHANVKPDKMDDFKEKLDDAFESLPCPELDMELVDMLRQYSRDLHFGIFHRGSRRRLQYDLKRAGLMESFLQEVCATVKYEEKWPYIDTWQDLTSRVGVAARQCLYLLSDKRVVNCRSDWRPTSGVLSGSCLGAQTAVLEQLKDGINVHVRSPMRKGRTVKIESSSVLSGRKKLFDELLKNRAPVLKRRRVLAQYEDDLLWYSALVEYEGGNDGKCWVKFHKFENRDWIPDEDLVELPRRDFRKMEKLEFPGLIDSDVSVL